MSRKESRKAKAPKTFRPVVGYHWSRHESTKIYVSDRWDELKATDKGVGIEIETNCTWYDVHAGTAEAKMAFGALLETAVFAEFPKDLFRWETDCSIRGPECVSQVMTKEFVRNHYPQFKNLFDSYLPAFGLLPNDDCGMHTNISLKNFGDSEEKQLDSARKLFYFINRHYEFCCVLLGRNINRNGYCERMPYANARSFDPQGIGSNHGISYNWGHYYEHNPAARRIELRLVGPCRNFNQFINTMETIFHLIAMVKKTSWKDLDNFAKCFRGCNKYVYDRLTRCYNRGVLDRSVLTAIYETSDKETTYFEE